MNSGDGERIWKLQTSANALVLEGKREADSYIQFLQNFVFGKDLGCELWLEAHKALGLEKEYLQGIKQLKFPAVDQNLWWLPMVQGVTSNKIVAGHRRFGVKYWLYADDLDTAVPTHDRDANRSGSYIVGFRRYVEADEEFANKSASQLITVNHKGITLPERLILGAGYHVATGQHLDVKNWTLCSGSRDRDGDVPFVRWHPGGRRVYVFWYCPGLSSDFLRSRSAQFSLPSSQASACEEGNYPSHCKFSLRKFTVGLFHCTIYPWQRDLPRRKLLI